MSKIQALSILVFSEMPRALITFLHYSKTKYLSRIEELLLRYRENEVNALETLVNPNNKTFEITEEPS